MPTFKPARLARPSHTPGSATAVNPGAIKRTTYSLAGQTIATRVTADPVAANNGLFYIYGDYLGSTNVLSDMAGTKVDGSLTRYLPFGDYRGSAPTQTLTDRDLTGQKENRELGLLYYHARYYVPGLGRFASADTIVPDLTNPQSFNRYAYTFNNPVKYTDSTGHCVFVAIDTAFCIFAAIMLGGISAIDAVVKLDDHTPVQAKTSEENIIAVSGEFNFFGAGKDITEVYHLELEQAALLTCDSSCVSFPPSTGGGGKVYSGSTDFEGPIEAWEGGFITWMSSGGVASAELSGGHSTTAVPNSTLSPGPGPWSPEYLSTYAQSQLDSQKATTVTFWELGVGLSPGPLSKIPISGGVCYEYCTAISEEPYPMNEARTLSFLQQFYPEYLPSEYVEPE